MNFDPLRDLAETWREEAALFRQRGLDGHARVAESYAADLEERLRQWRLEALTLEEATAESGYSYSALQKRVASGDLPNAGEKGSPRIRRCDLPQKGGSPCLEADEPDISGEILTRRSAG